ncbi:MULTISPECIES: ribonuclease E activity regulator RraA [unclassified Herbaspirillum]|uniref:ribonuclease E activity regulator RraA n=1 Tax=unclassified Herbaspirillum TaxID=2624150 RepID=UPI00114D5F24|nr:MULTISPECIES: ribonuclease E activity regulator RraA [unclassified Herbaspirillum]MBB5392984.1 regulator of ribonuclease activity A [Herbaspirillum sp. SJZ102]TQK04371.1 regulator of ribonuclease activity A [Herbaspirillum sp. SJZ130]TQK09844.1 regulator of ribonuclease activity A [Herbaspirillum sp. SJZ106]TWC65806.1 regulator of ribonuclease activity A [Herbaspirillum sp. SJZ099]
MSFATCDLCDNNEDKLAAGALHVLPPIFASFGKQHAFAGPARTLKVFEDNVLVRAALETPGDGHVLVVDGGGSLRCALVGGNLGMLAQKNGWAGILVNGCVRDAAELNACDIGIRALATHPQRSFRKGAGDAGLKVSIAGVAVYPGDWIYADVDGVLVSRTQL